MTYYLRYVEIDSAERDDTYVVMSLFVGGTLPIASFPASLQTLTQNTPLYAARLGAKGLASMLNRGTASWQTNVT